MAAERKAVTHLSFTDGRGNEITREIRHTLDIRDFLGTPAYSSLVVAANTHLSVANIELFLDVQAEKYPCVARSRSWIQRRRWTFQKPGTNNTKGREADGDGKQSIALKLMAQHPKASALDLVKLLDANGIRRSREWVRKHRCDLPPASHRTV